MLTRVQQLLVWVAALTPLAHAQEQCESTQIGNATEYAFNLEEQRVEPDMFTLEISEPDVCSDLEPVGMKVTACDADKAPKVYLMDTTRGLVVREGNVENEAYVYITVFCASDFDDTSDESIETPSLSSRFSEQALLTSSIPSSPSVPSTVGFSSTSATSSPQPWSTLTPDSLLPSEDEPTSILTSLTGESLPQMNLESRFSSLEQFKGPSIPSRLKAMWQPSATPSLGQLKKSLLLNPRGASSRWYENEPSLLDKQSPSIFDSYYSFLNGLPSLHGLPTKKPSSPRPDTSSPSLAKRLSGLRPEPPPQWFTNRSPAWLKRPTRHPSSPWLKQRSLSDWATRKSMSRLRKRPTGRSFDDGDPWSPYDEDPLSLHWSEERTDPFPWWIEGEPPSYSGNDASWRSNYLPTQNWNDAVPNTLLPERPPQQSIKHHPKKHVKHVPPIHGEDPALLALWKDLQWSPRPFLPKLLLLLQKQDHSSLTQAKCTSAHSVEDAEPWWSNTPYKEDEGIPWQPDYPSDYSADDGDSWKRISDDRERLWVNNIPQPSHPASVFNEDYASSRSEWSEHPPTDHPPWCPQCPPVNSIDVRKQHWVQHAPRHSSDTVPSTLDLLSRPPLDYAPAGSEPFIYYSPTPMTERPLLTSTVRHSLSWVKSSKSAAGSRTRLKQTSSPAGEQSENAGTAPWSFLSKLLLSHPTFRDSTHVIRI